MLSIHDDLTGVADDGTLSYLVVGWYSAAKHDPSTQVDSLAKLSWQVAGSTDTTPPATTLYSGYSIGVHWQRTGSVPVSQRPDGESVGVAVGNNAADALTGLLLSKKADPLDAALLEALHYGLLDDLDDAGTESVDQSIHRAWFGATDGGHVWEIVDRTSNAEDRDPPPPPPLTKAERDAEERLLSTLNTAQGHHDAAVRELFDAQWKLYGVWWLNNSPTLPDIFADPFAAALDPAKSGLAAGVRQRFADIAARRSSSSNHPEHIPWGATPEELAQAADAYLKDHGIDIAHRELKRVPLGEFHRANDPVTLLCGLKGPARDDTNGPLTCRLPGSLLTQIDLGNGLISAPPTPPTPPVDKLPTAAAVRALVAELWLLDQAFTAGTLTKVVADPKAKAVGTLPQFGATPWTQPWSPLYLMYELNFFPIPYQNEHQTNWTFDGTRYHWQGTGTGDAPAYEIYSGRIHLTSNATFTLAAQIRRYIATHPDTPTDSLKELERQVARWDLLSQALDGLTLQMTRRDPSVAGHPYDERNEPTSLATLIGDQHRTFPIPGDPPKGSSWPQSHFQQTRSGQFAFTRLHVIDVFGQVCDVINPDGTGSPQDSDRKPIACPDSTRPGQTVLAKAPYRFVELRPRLVQSARLRFDHVSALDDDHVLALDIGGNPVCGWLLPNHLDQGLSAYAPTGEALGEMRVVYGSNNQPEVWWDPAPGGQYPDIASLCHDFRHLADFLAGLRDAGPASFSALLKTIDETLWSVNPLGNWDDSTMTVLAGRPLALVRARLRLELDGPPLLDPSWEQWQYVVGLKDNQPLPPFVSYPWWVRLGSVYNLDDGLIGYQTEADGSRFLAVHAASVSDPYIEPIGAGFPLTVAGTPDSAHLTMLIDPRAAVHATTDVLPVSVLRLPSGFIDVPLSRMEIALRMGPLLSQVAMLGAQEQDRRLVLPRPSTRHGDWTWT